MKRACDLTKLVAAFCSLALSAGARADRPPSGLALNAAVAPPPDDGDDDDDGGDDDDGNEPPAPVPAISHEPLGSAPAGEDLVVRFRVTAAHELSEMTLHHRRAGQIEYRRARFGRAADGNWAAVIPASELQPGVIEYFIGSRSALAPDQPERLHFASPDAPHAVIILGDSEARWRKKLLAEHLGNHSRFLLSGEYVDFGGRTVFDTPARAASSSMRDHYWRGELDYTYRILSPVYSIRLGVGLLRGDTWVLAPDGTTQVRPDKPIGFDYGFAEVRLRFGRLVRLDLKTTLGASGRGFDGGAGGQLLIGNDPGTHFALGVDGVSHVGVRGWLRLAWNTVPRVPMSFTIEVTNLPFNENVGGRVYLAAGYRFNRHFSMNANVGYATRDFRIGGPGVGLGAEVEF